MAENETTSTNTNTSNKNQDLTKFLIMTIASIVIMFIVFAGVNYVIMENLISQKISSIQTNSEELGEDEGDSDEIQKGIIVDLGDFILNLCDENAKKYLKVNVAIEVSKKDEDFPAEDPAAAKSGGHGHGEAAPPKDPMAEIQAEMNKYKPAIRDAVITNLSSKTSSELATAAGKNLQKNKLLTTLIQFLREKEKSYV